MRLVILMCCLGLGLLQQRFNMQFPDFSYEEKLIDMGYIPCGTDEVGYGTLAGPLTVAAVIVPEDSLHYFAGVVRDSKKLTKKKREELSAVILDECICSLYNVNSKTIDEINILEAKKLGTIKAIEGLDDCDFALVDGQMDLHELSIPYNNINQGDNISISIACASIIAKVFRDTLMQAMSLEYMGYGFETNMGYGTKVHKDGIVKYGVTPIHRKTFKGVREYI